MTTDGTATRGVALPEPGRATPPPQPGARLSPLVRRLLAEHSLSPRDVPGTGADGRVTPDDVLAAATADRATSAGAPGPEAPRSAGGPAAQPGGSGRGLRLSPLVRRLLREHGLDPHRIEGSGAQGRITPDDVRSAAADGSAPSADVAPSADATPAATTAADTGARTRGPAPATPAPGPTDGDDGRTREEPLTRTRRIIAERMLTSLRTTAQLTAAVEADVTRIMHVRARLRDAAKARYGFTPSPLAFIAQATCRALAHHPVINASIDADAGTVTYHRPVDLGIAVDTPTGLMVPVIRDADELTVVALQRRINDLAARARDRELGPDDLQGGTFTITNTGSGGTLFDTPILNPPQAAILATPRIEKRPVVVTDDAGNDQVAIRQRTYLCLTYDHRLIDGADAARFLTDLAGRLDGTDWEQELGELTS